MNRSTNVVSQNGVAVYSPLIVVGLGLGLSLNMGVDKEYILLRVNVDYLRFLDVRVLSSHSCNGHSFELQTLYS